jgi:Tfp pilus assembly protein PilO
MDKRRIFILGIYCLVIIELFFIVPAQLKKFASTRKKSRQLQQQINSYQQSIDNEQQLRQQTQQIKLDIANLKGKIVPLDSLSQITSYISQQAEANEAEILSILPGKLQDFKKIEGKQFSYLPVKIELKADFHSLGKFLAQLYKSGYFLQVKELLIKSNSPYHDVRFVVVALVEKNYGNLQK